MNTDRLIVDGIAEEHYQHFTKDDPIHCDNPKAESKDEHERDEAEDEDDEHVEIKLTNVQGRVEGNGQLTRLVGTLTVSGDMAQIRLDCMLNPSFWAQVNIPIEVLQQAIAKKRAKV